MPGVNLVRMACAMPQRYWDAPRTDGRILVRLLAAACCVGRGREGRQAKWSVAASINRGSHAIGTFYAERHAPVELCPTARGMTPALDGTALIDHWERESISGREDGACARQVVVAAGGKGTAAGCRSASLPAWKAKRARPWPCSGSHASGWTDADLRSGTKCAHTVLALLGSAGRRSSRRRQKPTHGVLPRWHNTQTLCP